MESDKVQAGCKAIRNVSEEMADLREIILCCDNLSLMNDATLQYEYQSLMVRGIGVLLETMAMLLEDADKT